MTLPDSKKDSDTQDFVTASSICTHNKALHRKPVGLLQPLPGHLWSHISLDLITGLPPSQGNTIIITIVVQVVHFVALSKLPTAWETADLIISHIFNEHMLSCAHWV